jgi:acetyl esterase/lipase
MIRAMSGLLVGAVLWAAVPASAAPPVESYGKLPAMEEVHLSPSGERYAFIAFDGKSRRVYVAGQDGKALMAVNVGDAKVRYIAWAGDDHVLIDQSATIALGPNYTGWQAELATVVVLNLPAKTSFRVFENNYKVLGGVHGSFGTGQIDGHWYGWFGGRPCHVTSTGCAAISQDDNLFRVDLDSGAVELAARGQADSAGWLIGPKGEVLARSFYNEKGGIWQIMTGGAGGQVVASGHNDFGGAGDLHFGRTPNTLLVNAPTGEGGKDSGAYVYRELSIAGAPEMTAPNIGAMDEPVFDPVTHLWIGETLRNDLRETVLFSPTLQARWAGTRKAFPNNMAHLISWSADFNRLVVYTDGGDDSGTYWSVDIQKHSADPIGSAYPDVKPADVGQVRMIEYHAADGLALHGVLTLPTGRPAKSLPLVVLPHGGPEARDYPGFDWLAQAFASRGYAVFQPNFRGSSGYGVELRNAGLGQWGRKMQTDISDGVADLAKQGIVDPKRACIAGASYGGYAALAGVTLQHDLYRCAVSIAGVADLVGMLKYDYDNNGRSSSGMRYWQAFMGVNGFSESAQLKPISPAELADRADAPILLIHGRDDTVVPIAQSRTMQSALGHAGKPVEMLVMQNEDHWLSREATRVEMLKAAVAFVEKNNPPN